MRGTGALLGIVIVLVATAGCPPGPNGPTTAKQSCALISPPGLPAGSEVGGISACMAPADCNNNDANLLIQNGLKVCATLGSSACAKGDCPLPQDCKPEYLSKTSNGVTIDCKAAADPKCAAPQQLCTCQVKVATPGNLSCGCRCMNPAG